MKVSKLTEILKDSCLDAPYLIEMWKSCVSYVLFFAQLQDQYDIVGIVDESLIRKKSLGGSWKHKSRPSHLESPLMSRRCKTGHEIIYIKINMEKKVSPFDFSTSSPPAHPRLLWLLPHTKRTDHSQS